MQREMVHAPCSGVIDRCCQRFHDRRCVIHRKRAAVPQDNVERIADRVLLREVGCAAFKACRYRSRDVGMT